MICPHCSVAFHDGTPNSQTRLGRDADGHWSVQMFLCPECGKATITLEVLGGPSGFPHHSRYQAYPDRTKRPLPSEVPTDFASEFDEADAVLPYSPAASAAISRRCLQRLLREHAGVPPLNLSKEIQHVLDSGELRGGVADGLDAIRELGNFATHPIKSSSTGEVVPVDPDEAELTLDVLDSLFDHYFVQPARLDARLDAIDEKLADAGRRPLRRSGEDGKPESE